VRAAVLRRVAAAEARVSAWAPPPRPSLRWMVPVGLERPDLRPLPECMAQRAVERALYNTPHLYWPTDLPEMWPLLAGFRDWFNARHPGRWGELSAPFPEQLPDGSWRSQEAAPPGTGSNRLPRGRRRRSCDTGGAEA
jgi:hypothetical protein